jgi:putative transposase
VTLNAVCVMSNHWHGVVTDPQARLPQFLGRFHGLLAKAQNASLGRWENLWSSEKASIVNLVSPDDVLAKMAYTIANPTSAGLVESPEHWPGVIAWPGMNQKLFARKPPDFFASASALPDSISVQLARPAILGELSEVEFSKLLNRAVDDLVHRARHELASRGLKFLGRESVRKQSFQATPGTLAARRDLDPTIAARSPTRRVQVLLKKEDFVRRYRRAWQRYRAGVRDVKFPPGTYALRLNSAVDCDP